MATNGQEARALGEIVRAVGSSLELREVLDLVVRALTESTPANRCFVYLTEAGGERLALAAASEPYAHLAGRLALERGQGITGWTAEHGTPVFIPEQPEQDPRFAFVPEIDANEEGWCLAAPMTGRDGSAIGTIIFTGAEPGQVGESTVELLVSATALVAAPIENARLLERARRFAAQQTAVAALGRRALQSNDLDRLMNEAATIVAEGLSVEAVGVLELMPGATSLRLRAGFGWDDLVGRTVIDAGKGSVGGYTLLAGEPVISLDVRTDERFVAPPSLLQRGVVSSMSVVIHGRDRPFGALGAHATERRRFDPDEVSFLQSVANVLSDAVEHQGSVAALRESEERFRSVFESTSIAIAVTDVPAGGIVRVNRAFEELVGRTEAELLGKTISEFTHPDDLATKLELFQGLQRGERDSFRFENRYIRPDGTVVWGDATGSLVRDADGSVVSYIGLVTDVTDRKRAEEALRRSEERLAKAQEIAHLGSWEWDVASDALGWSDETFRICGVEPGSFVPTIAAFHALVPPEDREDMLAAVADAFGGAPYVLEHRIVRPDGDVRFVRELGQVEFDAAGQPVCMLGTVLDITDRKRAEEERRLLEAQIQHMQKLESLGILAGGIAHDFNNLLMGILGNAGLARLDLPEGPLLERISQIETAAQRAAELTNQLLAYAGKARFEVAAVDLADLVREMTHLLEVPIPKKVRLTYDLDSGLPPVEADPTQLRQVVMNLITNAAEAIGEREGAIAVRVSTAEVGPAELAGQYAAPELEPGTYLALEVEDTGAGMDRATLERIFDPFFTTKFAGRGLGLAAVLGIARAHRGAISVRSEPGRGTLFRILLPPTSAAAYEEPPESEERAGHVGGTVLVVDDDESVRAVTRAMLERFGYRTLAADDGQGALQLFQERSGEIDLVLLDMTMPVMDGIETLHALRELRPGVPVLLSSGHAESEAQARLGGECPSGFIQKPYRPSELAERVRQSLAA
jgi:PAS domain S-box-containing protein